MMYRVKPEFIDNWSDDTAFSENPIVDDAEINRLAAEWGIPVDELMEQVEEI